jgi:hypothetical protein
MPAVGASRNPERQREDTHGEFHVGNAGPHFASGAGDHCGARLAMTDRVQRLVAVHIVSFDKGIVPERVLDLDRGCLEERSFALSIGAFAHSMPSIEIASSR